MPAYLRIAGEYPNNGRDDARSERYWTSQWKVPWVCPLDVLDLGKTLVREQSMDVQAMGCELATSS